MGSVAKFQLFLVFLFKGTPAKIGITSLVEFNEGKVKDKKQINDVNQLYKTQA